MTKRKSYPVVEIYGPTIQGEGLLIGLPTLFLRLGGCDYRCSWCDSLFAVLPDQLRGSVSHMSPTDILKTLSDKDPTGHCDWLTLTGGNPLLYDLESLFEGLQGNWYINVETQGSIWRDCLLHRSVKKVTVSPKPPSSGYSPDLDVLRVYKHHLGSKLNFKVVIFNEEDLDFAGFIRVNFPTVAMTLQLGTVTDDTATSLCAKLALLTELALSDTRFTGVPVLPQLHVLMWGHRRRV